MVKKQQTIIIDLMSGESGPQEAFNGVIKFAQEFPKWKCIVVGSKKVLDNNKNDLLPNIEFLISSSVIKMEDNDPLIYRKKPDSSLSIAIKSLISKKGSALISSANTKVYISAIFLSSAPLIANLKPAIAILFPTKNNNYKTILDGGGFVDRQPEDMLDLAILGEQYHKITFNCLKPRLALICNGTEDFKGDKLTKATHKILKEQSFTYQGLVEPTTLFDDEYDVLLGDGFAINILGKTVIATSKFIKESLKKSLSKNLWRKINALFLKKAFNELKQNLFSNEKLGGGMILGVEDFAFKAPGKTMAKGYYNTLVIVKKMLEKEMITKMKRGLHDTRK